MWICPRCGREFKKINQSHYCGQAPKTVDEYIELQPLETQRHLRKMRNILLKSVPCLKMCIRDRFCMILVKKEDFIAMMN